ncbi:MAG: beta-N-acetylhexosaminidase [Alphaproteobacteria bacterium]|nr:beta-N-acetylhexosaminidase [Alphaproteobacteria bacterium]
MTKVKPVLLGLEGGVLTNEERSFFAQLQPFGFILFQRNCLNPAQLKSLTNDLRETVQREDVPIFIDQEGGRVARLKPPCWPDFPAARVLGEAYEKDPASGLHAAAQHAREISFMLSEVGINGNCAPVLDLLVAGASDAIGDRAFSADPDVAAACGRQMVENMMACGVMPVIKHFPGHGRVKIDPHLDLPFVDAPLEVLEQQDFKPFAALRDAPCGMNCHVVFNAIDDAAPVSLSKRAHDEIIRGALGFEGLLFSDDLAMGALKMPIEERGRLALEAGADVVLFCRGVLEESQAFCADLPEISDAASARWERARKQIKNCHCEEGL